ncbi:MAG: PE-PPE domain-containing protein, partial [Nannocystaceae bacterium]
GARAQRLAERGRPAAAAPAPRRALAAMGNDEGFEAMATQARELASLAEAGDASGSPPEHGGA